MQWMRVVTCNTIFLQTKIINGTYHFWENLEVYPCTFITVRDDGGHEVWNRGFEEQE